MSVKSSTELMLYVVLTMPTLNKAYLFIYLLFMRVTLSYLLVFVFANDILSNDLADQLRGRLKKSMFSLRLLNVSVLLILPSLFNTLVLSRFHILFHFIFYTLKSGAKGRLLFQLKQLPSFFLKTRRAILSSC